MTRIKVTVWSIFGQSFEALEDSVIQVETQLVESFHGGLEDEHTSSQFCSYYFTHISSIVATSVEVQSSTPHGGGDESASDASSPMSFIVNVNSSDEGALWLLQEGQSIVCHVVFEIFRFGGS